MDGDELPPVDDWFDEPRLDERRPPRRRPTLPGESSERPPPPARALAIAALVVLLVIVLGVLALTRDGSPEAEPVDETAIEEPVTETAEPEEPETEEPPQTLPTEAIIRPGDEGEPVTALQRALAELGYDVGEPDGNYGPMTVEAVRQFQTDAGIEADGIAGPLTLQAINARRAG